MDIRAELFKKTITTIFANYHSLMLLLRKLNMEVVFEHREQWLKYVYFFCSYFELLCQTEWSV